MHSTTFRTQTAWSWQRRSRWVFKTAT